MSAAGGNQGKYSTLRSLATLAYDCRRSEKFRAELLDALRIIERGDLTPNQMIGAWAGEIGQTQFLASAYLKFAVDFEGYGHRDLIHSGLNALASTANYLKNYGWTAGKPWTEGSANFGVLQKWNESEVYAKTVAYFATRLAKEPYFFLHSLKIDKSEHLHNRLRRLPRQSCANRCSSSFLISFKRPTVGTDCSLVSEGTYFDQTATVVVIVVAVC